MKRPDGTWDPFDDYVLDFAIERMRAGERAAIVTLVEIEGASPRPLGAQMAVCESGRWVGYLSGGCIERAVAEEAVEAIVAGRCRRIRYGRGSRYIDISLPCGSAIELIFDVRVPLDRLEALDAALRQRRPAALQVPFGEPAVDGEVGPSARFVRHYLPRRRLVVFGLGPVAVQLAGIADATGLEVVLHTPDPVTAQAARKGGVAVVEAGGVIDLASVGVDARSAIVLAFHDHDREERLLPAALATEAFYIGAMGSRTTHDRRLERLRGMGFAERQLQRICGPAGLLQHARSAADLAVSILAEVIDACRRSEAAAAWVPLVPRQAPDTQWRGHHDVPGEARL
jgi:xanthine dehydrogenase accessory factor